jgi:hypothetical protein
MATQTFIVSFLTGNWPATAALGDRYARVMAASYAKHAPGAEFVLFTDRKAISGVNTRTLPNLGGWWGSLYQFSPEAFPEGSRVFSVDLDTAIVGDLTPLLEVDLTTLVGIDDRGPRAEWRNKLTNGVMSWIAGPRYYQIWEDFKKNVGGKPPFRLPNGHPCVMDETWLNHYIGADWRGWDVKNVMSYKWDFISMRRPVTPDTRIVYFHGQPRPHQVNQPWNPHYLHPGASVG